MTPLFILMVFIHVGAMGDGNSNSSFSQEFYSKQTCESAGQQFKRLANSTVKVIDYVCVSK